MVVDKIDGGQDVQRTQNIKRRDTEARTSPVQSARSGDSVELSGQAREASKIHESVNLVRSVPDVARKERVEAARERILGGDYLSPKVVDDIANKIAKLLIK